MNPSNIHYDDEFLFHLCYHFRSIQMISYTLYPGWLALCTPLFLYPFPPLSSSFSLYTSLCFLIYILAEDTMFILAIVLLHASSKSLCMPFKPAWKCKTITSLKVCPPQCLYLHFTICFSLFFLTFILPLHGIKQLLQKPCLFHINQNQLCRRSLS